VELNNPHSLNGLFSYPRYFIGDLFKAFKFANSIRGQTIVVTMISPFDLVPILFFRVFRIKIYTIIHDYSPHSGEKWPTNRAIKRRMVLSKVSLFLSATESEKAQGLEQNKKATIFHPVLHLDTSVFQELDLGLDLDSVPIFLFIGRLVKYKGLEMLVQTWKPDLPAKLIIAGEGSIQTDTGAGNVTLINKWLTEYEIDYLIQKSDYVVFPYIEASQSGLLPIVISKGKKVILSDLPSFKEQVGPNDRSVVWFPAGDSVALETTIRRIVKNHKETSSLTSSIEIDYSMSRFLAELANIIERFNGSK
jgi:glycosyltransferase involved in cell wall biosynthesis